MFSLVFVHCCCFCFCCFVSLLIIVDSRHSRCLSITQTPKLRYTDKPTRSRTSIERDHKQIPVCKKGQPSVAVKIEMGGHNQPAYGRQLEEKDVLYSMVSRQSINCLKDYYRSEVTADEWQLLIKLKPLFDIS